MKTNEEAREQSAKLRWRAEEVLRRGGMMVPMAHENRRHEEPEKTLHELHVHQIELTMQNEELFKAQLELEAARARYFDLYDLAPVGYCILSQEGLILEANLTAVTLLGTARATLVKQQITRFILPEDQDIYYLYRKRFLEQGHPNACELRMLRRDGTHFWVRLTATIGQGPSTPAEPDRQGEEIFRMVMSDISDRKLLEEEKLRLEEQLGHTRRHRRSRLQATLITDKRGAGRM